MCGIAGVMERTGGPPSASRVAAAIERIRHRGPDETGFWSDNRVSLGMCRLAIIAPTDNHQPAASEDGSVQVVFNGQIYNHPQLRAELEATGHRFASQGDSEVIAHAYEQWGTGFLERLNGMFAIAVYDARDGGSILLARDRVGIKPLHYHLDHQRLIFGSEVKAVLAQLDRTPSPDVEGMLSLLTFEYTYAPHTLFNNICKLPPGHFLQIDRGGVKMQSYWQLPTCGRTVDEVEAVGQLRDVVSDAVSKRMISDVPLGAFLSGGVDSSIIVALMARHSSRKVKTFSVGFKDASYDESSYARMVAERYQTDHEEIRLDLKLDEMTKPLELILDDPIGDFSVFSTYLVSQAARAHVTVALSGDGGDELFGGYDTYIADKVARVYRLLGATMTERLFPKLLSMLPPTPSKKGIINKVKAFVSGAARSTDLGHVRWMMFMDDSLRGSLLAPDFAETVRDIDPTNYVRRLIGASRFRDASQTNMYVDSAFYLPENILHKVDRTSMATSLETRVPLLDHRVVEAALTLPGSLRLKGFQTKSVLKRAFGDLLPQAIVRRGKQGFSTPMKHWLRGDLKPMMLDVLSESQIRRDGYFQPDTVERLKREHLDARYDHAHILWSLMLWCMWLNRFQRSNVDASRPIAKAIA